MSAARDRTSRASRDSVRSAAEGCQGASLPGRANARSLIGQAYPPGPGVGRGGSRHGASMALGHVPKGDAMQPDGSRR